MADGSIDFKLDEKVVKKLSEVKEVKDEINKFLNYILDKIISKKFSFLDLFTVFGYVSSIIKLLKTK